MPLASTRENMFLASHSLSNAFAFHNSSSFCKYVTGIYLLSPTLLKEALEAFVGT